MESKYAAKLNSLGFEPPAGCIAPSEELVAKLEKRIARSLPLGFVRTFRFPPEYREFLIHHAGAQGSAGCKFQEPTPFGDSTEFDGFFGIDSIDGDGDILENTILIDGAPEVVAIGDNSMGDMFWLKCTGTDVGSVYFHGAQPRASWKDEESLLSRSADQHMLETTCQE